MPRALEKLQKSRNHNFSRHRRYRAPFPFALQSAYSQNPTLNVGDLSLLGCQRWIEVAAKCAILVGTLKPRRHGVGGFYRCNKCKIDFTVRTGTIFERSHVPLHKWIYAMYLVVTARKGISSMQLAKEIGTTQKSAWFVLQRLREACGGSTGKSSGLIEIDECYVGGKETNKHESKKLNMGRGTVGKTAVMGLRERGGRTVAMTVANTNKETLLNAILANVEAASVIMTDEHSAYVGIGGMFLAHETVNHGAGEYQRGFASTNGIESVWALSKRGIYGTWHQVSAKHLDRYVSEVSFRLNAGDVKQHTIDRLHSFVDAVDGKRLTYARLTA